MPIHFESFVSIRRQYPRRTERAASRTSSQPPETAQERDYRDLLSEANANFFHREYRIALDNYLALRQKILVQSHPELPVQVGIETVAVKDVDWKRIVELSRRVYLRAEPGDPPPLRLGDERLIQAGEFPANPAFQAFAALGLDPGVQSQAELAAQRLAARDLVLEGDLDTASRVYADARAKAEKRGDLRLAADLAGEQGTMMATYAEGNARAASLKQASQAFTEASDLYVRVGDTAAQAAMKANLEAAGAELSTPSAPAPGPFRRNIRLRLPAGLRTFQLADRGTLRPAAAVLADKAALPSAERTVGLWREKSVFVVPLARAAFEDQLVETVYKPRKSATALEAIDFSEIVGANFVAYIPHLFFYVLPLAIGDTYLALGQYSRAVDEYRAALSYPFLNGPLEAANVWLRLAKAYLSWGDALFRAGDPAGARTQYRQILAEDLTVPLGSPLYQPAELQPFRTVAAEVVKKIKGEAFAPVNPQAAERILQAHLQLQKIAHGLNFLGLGPDDFPIFRFRFLQSVATYMADNAIQAERTFINFRTSAESQKLERLQLESAVEVNRAALGVEDARLRDAELERQAAGQSRRYAELRAQHARDTLGDWNTLGRELASVNAALSWAGNAANDADVKYTGVRYNGTRHDFDTDVEEFFDVVGEWREHLNFELQQRRLERQIAESDAEVGLARTREAQADVRFQIQKLSLDLARIRLDGARETLEYATNRTFDEDLWFRLANELQDLARTYLDSATYAAFLMERAYDLELDRRLNRIRLDYGFGGVEGLLGGDQIKRDIAAFTLDYLQNAQKKNPVRMAISLRDEFPAAFATFQTEGILALRTDLEIFDRRHPGTYRRKLKKVEVFVEGLVPLEGVSGLLTHQGVSTEWREGTGGAWVRHTRIHAPERMVLSSYQFRRDLTVFQPSEEMLDLFENLGPQGNWRLELPRSANNLDYQAISDIKLVLYFDCEHSDSLRAHVKAFYPAQSGRSLVLSSRFHFPDQYFRLDTERSVTFDISPARFAYNATDLKLNGFGVRVIGTPGTSVGGVPLTVVRVSDGSEATGVTDAQGLLLGDATDMAPFAAWKGESPAEGFTVRVGEPFATAGIADVQLLLDYQLNYRPDGTLAA